MFKKEFSPNLRKHIRKEKARIRREVLDLDKQEELIKGLYVKLNPEKIERKADKRIEEKKELKKVVKKNKKEEKPKKQEKPKEKKEKKPDKKQKDKKDDDK
ncbi:hypothetical protein KKC63_00725 [Patescibacteria group bacterium]|nr:hypothetical protein [Patescibacteria group bacterium]MBU4022884.1 hypothetical protein [Patescibacteria group bacterium]MBU4078106.1 hypothetical protein [Patescibacteria group bacterium]